MASKSIGRLARHFATGKDVHSTATVNYSSFAGLNVVNGASEGGMGSLLNVTLQKNQTLTARPHSVIGISGTARTKIVLPTSTVDGVWSRVSGGPFFLHKIETSDSANALLSPSNPTSDIAVIDLNKSDIVGGGGATLVCTNGSFLASTGSIRLTGSSKGVIVSGSGQVAISSHGIVHRLVLQAGEEYHINPNNLLAYCANIHPRYSHLSAQVPSIVEEMSLLQIVQYHILRSIRRVTVDPLMRVRLWFLGDKDSLYRLQGPGEFYIGSRQRPTLHNLIGAVAEIQYQGSQLRETWRHMRSSGGTSRVETSVAPSNPPSPPTSPRSFTAIVDNGQVEISGSLFETSQSPSVVDEEKRVTSAPAQTKVESPPSRPPQSQNRQRQTEAQSSKSWWHRLTGGSRK